MRKRLVILATLLLAIAACSPAAWAAWSFGIIADTQWTLADDGKNPNGVAVDIINQINREMIARGVKFVVAVGDVTNLGNKSGLDTRATYAQALYNAGIGFYPLRGNHEPSQAAAQEFQRVFPQTRNGQNNATPADAFVTTPDDAQTHPAKKTGTTFTVGTHFTSSRENLAGLSYSFQYENAQFVLLDQFASLDGGKNTIVSQQPWIVRSLASKPAGGHAFVFGHKGLITANHADTLFGSNPAADAAGQDAFITALQHGGVRYYIGGHDHIHNRARVTTTDGKSARVQEIIAASDSSKFYTPAKTSNDEHFNIPAFGHARETPIAQELYAIGYYVCTVDGPRVTIDYFGVPTQPAHGSITTTPPLTGHWQRRESFGYSLNGKEFVVAQQGSYTCVADAAPTDRAYFGTQAKVLDGVYGGKAKDYAGRPLVKVIDTGWSSGRAAGGNLKSDVLTLWGFDDCPVAKDHRSDRYVLSLTFDAADVPAGALRSGAVGIVTRGPQGNWIDAATAAGSAAQRKFVFGPYQAVAHDPVGTYGVDTANQTAWAVLDRGGEFAVHLDSK